MSEFSGLDPITRTWVARQQAKYAKREEERAGLSQRDRAEGQLYAESLGRARRRAVRTLVWGSAGLAVVGAVFAGDKLFDVNNPFAGSDAPSLDNARTAIGREIDEAGDAVADAVAGNETAQHDQAVAPQAEMAAIPEGYVVQPGDTFYEILGWAGMSQVEVDACMDATGTDPRTDLIAGQVFVNPC